MFAENSIVNKSKPVYYEGIFIILIGFLIVGNTTITDIVFHDGYVKPLHECHPDDTDSLCQSMRVKHNCATDDPTSCLGEAYWNELARQAVFIGFIMFAIRIGIAYFLKFSGLRLIRPATIMMALFWGILGSSLFMFGFLDTFYYWFVLESPPDELAWLNSAGLFTEAKTWTGDPTLVEIEDLYLLNVIGLLIILIYLYIIMHTYAQSGLSNKGIA